MIQTIHWNSSFSVGIEVIDEQHQHMISIINSLFEEKKKKIGEININEFFKEAVDYGEYHFQTEETFFKHREYPEREQHLVAHQVYKETLNNFLVQSTDSRTQAESLLDFLEKWWLGHINGIDQTLRPLKS